MRSILEFAPGTLRPQQKQALLAVEANYHKYDVFVITAPTACHAKGQKVLMFDGSFKNVEDVVEGDQLMGPDSQPRNVLKLYTGTSKMATIVPKRGYPWTVTENHILSLQSYEHPGTTKEITCEEWLTKSNNFKYQHTLWKPENIEWPPQEQLIDPYILGLWLGDGSSRDVVYYTTMDEDLAQYWQDEGKKFQCTAKITPKVMNAAYTISMTTPRGQPNDFLKAFQYYNLQNNKHIPREYKIASRNQRLSLLAGLMDSDGYFNQKASAEITQVNKDLAEDILFVIRSLGFSAQISEKVINNTPYWKIIFSGQHLTDIPVKCQRKAKPINSKSNQKNTRFTIKPAGIANYYGFELDGDHLYLLDDFTVTHNTGKSWLAVTIAKWLHYLQTQTAIVTPTKMLQDQYMEEFPQFPNLKGRTSYPCQKFSNKTCDDTYIKVGHCCQQCPYVETRKQCQDEDIIFANYHTLFANKIHKENLIIDEAHNVIPMLLDMFSLELWQHKHGFPDEIQYLGQLAVWLEQQVAYFDKLHEQGVITEEQNRRREKYRMFVGDLAHKDGKYYFECGLKKFGTRKQKYKQIVVKPMSAKYVPKLLWPKSTVRKIFLLSATIIDKDIEECGLNLGRRIYYINCDSPIPPENRPFVVEPIINMGYAHREESLPKLVNILEILADKHRDKGLVHVTYAIATQLKKYLKNDRFIYHTKTNKMDVYKKFRESNGNEILIASGMSEGIDLVEDAGRWQVIPMIPYISLADGWVKTKMKLDKQWYTWTAIRTIQQQAGRICRTPTDTGVTYMLDSRFPVLFFKTVKQWPKWFTEAMRWE